MQLHGQKKKLGFEPEGRGVSSAKIKAFTWSHDPEMGMYTYLQGGTPQLAKLVNITSITMVYG